MATRRKALRDRANVSLLSTYGVRGAQVRRLRLEDVDWMGERIHFSAVNRGRAVEQYLAASEGNRLAEYLRKGRPSSSHREVFLHAAEPFGPIAQPRELSKLLRKRMRQAGIELPVGARYGFALLSSRVRRANVWTRSFQGRGRHAWAP